MKIDEIISVCATRHFNVFQYTSKFVRKFISSDNYTVIIQPDGIDKFNNIEGWNVIDENNIGSFNLKYIQDKLKHNQVSLRRAYWYFQQLLKI